MRKENEMFNFKIDGVEVVSKVKEVKSLVIFKMVTGEFYFAEKAHIDIAEHPDNFGEEFDFPSWGHASANSEF